VSDPWVFGYGSLVWRPAFAHLERCPAHIVGWTRRFWQASPDHRGTPEAPGRVVTLVQAPDARCDGMAYRVEAAIWPEVEAALDHREQAGYLKVETPIQLLDGRRIETGWVYIAGPDNPNFIGPAPLEQMVRQIALSHGPSGANRDYLTRLAEALRAQGVTDPHLTALEAGLDRWTQ